MKKGGAGSEGEAGVSAKSTLKEIEVAGGLGAKQLKLDDIFAVVETESHGFNVVGGPGHELLEIGHVALPEVDIDLLLDLEAGLIPV